LLLHLHMDDRHLNYVKKFLNKTMVGEGGGED
jgi:hypothetical protein